MLKVFISYSSKDSDFAELMSFRLREKGFSVWLDKGDIHPGEDWRDEIEEGLSASNVLVAILSETAVASSYVTFEWAYALGKGAKVIPVILDKSKLHPRLESLQYFDFTNPRVRPWDQLVQEMSRVAKKQAAQNKIQEAQAAYTLAVDSFMDKLLLQFRTVHFVGFGSTLPGLHENRPSFRATNAFGEMVDYDTSKEGDEAASELRSVVSRIVSLRKSRERKIRKTLIDLLKTVQGSAQSIAHELRKVHFVQTTAEEPWRLAQEQILQLWTEKSSEFVCFDTYELDRLRQFLEQHPSYGAISGSDGEEIKYIFETGNVELDDLLDLTRRLLQSSLNNVQ